MPVAAGKDILGLDIGMPVAVTLGEPDGNWIQVEPLDESMSGLLRSGGIVISEGNERVNPSLPAKVVETVKYGEP